ncbi:MAG: CRISPR-associated helicase/endonuclease Cas3 [Desulfobacterales bacterium S5133MH4]|nr:MAG: CRISPR-associated helicase/endonuclease Cas3 [Desulfobacterales bacterium S5133MH4]
MKYYAHSLEGQPPDKWQLLEEHLKNVAAMATEFANFFHAKNWGALAGQNHDLGKGTLPWQAYLRKANGIIDEFVKYYEGHPNHAAVGAQWLYKNSREAGKLLAYCVAGHHGGLPNWNDSPIAALEAKLQKPFPEVGVPLSIPEFPANLPFPIDSDRFGFQLQFFVRMLFSCLVDADFLDTEASLDKTKSGWRFGYPGIKVLHERFWGNFKTLRDGADQTLNVNRQRELVLEDCLQAADMEPGLFSLTVPTGGGKTLASMAFALNHAINKEKRRIIYVIPFTSIIEQNAKVFREKLGDDAVLEHHCNFLPDDSDWKTKLAAENWDAPIVMTTNVQFFNSFYANKTSKCRKLHNVADSIIIFDEVQAIPVEKLKPCLEVIKELSNSYGVTSILCTATQPAIKFSEQFSAGLQNVREIIQDVPSLFTALKRTEEVFIGEFSEQDVANRLLEHEQVLCIVNTRQRALDIFNALPESDANFHLSALMHPAHRTEKLNEIRKRLSPANKLPCRVVSTQLIEAGVDVDFSCVFREVAGIDSIAQAAGRCNRNGLSEVPCKVYVFEFPEGAGCSFSRHAAQSAVKLFGPFAGKLTTPECVREYFADFFWKNEQRMDEDEIIEKLCRPAQTGNIQFRDIAKFQMIKSATEPVVIALEKNALELVRSLEFAEHKGGILRKLQQFSVQIYPYQLEEMKDWLENPVPGVWVLRSQELYSETTGLRCKPPEGNAFFG